MKQVAGTMKLNLAQYRELEAFSQFSSDLDERTKAQLDRGTRVNEILKQGWDTPLNVSEQVVVVFAAVNGMLDSVRVESITAWEKQFLEYMRTTHRKLLTEIDSGEKMSEKLEEQLTSAIKSFNDLHPEFAIQTSE